MWRGEVHYWNVVTGQTTATKPKPIHRLSSYDHPIQRLSATDKWSAAAERGTLDTALSVRVRARQEQSLDESMPYELDDVADDSVDNTVGREDDRVSLLSGGGRQESSSDDQPEERRRVSSGRLKEVGGTDRSGSGQWQGVRTRGEV